MNETVSKLRAGLADPAGPLVAPGCYDALSATLIEQAGFSAAYLSGASVAYTKLGRADVGLVSVTEVAEQVGLICDRVAIPLIVDADTGFGNALNVQRTVRTFERMGAAALQLEDQQAPKRCGHLSGKTLVSTAEMVGKIRAALDARDAALIVARTDAVAVEGFDAALERAHAYAEAGADLLFVEAPPSVAHMRQLCQALGGRVPLMANMVEGGTTPVLPAAELGAIGYRLVIFPGAFVRALVFMAREMLGALKADGTTEAYWSRMVDLKGVNQAVGAEALLDAGRAYDPGIQAWGVEPQGRG
ncbi:MAG TPA: isocitrate lyase/phosphoenolpyruvate mutase family protein [Caulobacteraceae bacterium]|nr:isocitrate lyase/phosphoenolpyruvate mutase family protein [Caulobacteraceae bacterium]